MSAEIALDFVLAAMLVWLAWAALSGRGLFRAVVLFIAFGMVMSLAWARLGAPDVALAEAAIGAGVTGALLLAACGGLRRSRESGRERSGTAPEEGDE